MSNSIQSIDIQTVVVSLKKIWIGLEERRKKKMMKIGRSLLLPCVAIHPKNSKMTGKLLPTHTRAVPHTK
jgi:hypothetical protein